MREGAEMERRKQNRKKRRQWEMKGYRRKGEE